MKKIIGIALVLLTAAFCATLITRRAVVSASAPGAAPNGKLVVHEWGTFTGFAGSDGVHLPFDTIVGSDLPAFVKNRLTYAERLHPELRFNMIFAKGGGVPALQRMETPVLYFYADAPRDVDVRVGFPRGLLTEFYPPVREMGPSYGKAPGEFSAAVPDQSGTVETSASFLDWGRVRIIPQPTAGEGRQIPAVTDKNHYQFARDTDSALVQLVDLDGKLHEEKFLFYRGLGDFTLPVKLTAQGHDHFEFHNADQSPVAAAFLIENKGNSYRFSRYENIARTTQMTLPAIMSTQDELAAAIDNSLVAAGLFEKEAAAMVATWKDAWLAEPGTRVLYLVPRTVTDALLPLTMSPTPEKSVRVLVGRIDILTPEFESRLASMMQTAMNGKPITHDDAVSLKNLSRFRAPALERISKQIGETDPHQPAVRKLIAAFWDQRAVEEKAKVESH